MQKLSLGEIEIQTEICYWLMSGTEEVKKWITWLGSTHSVFWTRPGPPATWELRHPQRTGCWSVWLSPCPSCHFSGKSRPGGSKGVGSGHLELAPMACDLYVQRAPQSEGTPPLLSLSWNASYFFNKGSHTFVSQTFISHWLLQIG